jgi:hypothetical protein
MLAMQTITNNPIPWPTQPALFPGLAPWPVLWAGKADTNQEGITYGYKALTLAIFHQALLDARQPGALGEDARQWLADSGLEWLSLAGVGVQPGKYRAWLVGGCKATIRGVMVKNGE